MDFVTKMAQKTSILIRTREMKLTKDQAMKFFDQNKAFFYVSVVDVIS
jgi:hypothetical protein